MQLWSLINTTETACIINTLKLQPTFLLTISVDFCASKCICVSASPFLHLNVSYAKIEIQLQITQASVRSCSQQNVPSTGTRVTTNVESSVRCVLHMVCAHVWRHLRAATSRKSALTSTTPELSFIIKHCSAGHYQQHLDYEQIGVRQLTIVYYSVSGASPLSFDLINMYNTIS